MTKIIECFVQRANNELPFGYSAHSADDHVLIYKEDHPIYLFPHSDILNDITGCLDLLPEIV
jgi:hypothetical protein